MKRTFALLAALALAACCAMPACRPGHALAEGDGTIHVWDVLAGMAVPGIPEIETPEVPDIDVPDVPGPEATQRPKIDIPDIPGVDLPDVDVPEIDVALPGGEATPGPSPKPAPTAAPGDEAAAEDEKTAVEAALDALDDDACRAAHRALLAGEVLVKGTRGDLALGVQKLLVVYGQDIELDANVGGKTIAALKAAQASVGLEPTDTLDAAGFEALLVRLPMLNHGDSVTTP